MILMDKALEHNSSQQHTLQCGIHVDCKKMQSQMVQDMQGDMVVSQAEFAAHIPPSVTTQQLTLLEHTV